jgi:hypothetical protein
MGMSISDEGTKVVIKSTLKLDEVKLLQSNARVGSTEVETTYSDRDYV